MTSDIYSFLTYLCWGVPIVCWFIAMVILTIKRPCKAAYLMTFSASLVASASASSFSFVLGPNMMDAMPIDPFLLFEIINWTYHIAALGMSIGLLLYINMLNHEWQSAKGTS